MTTTIPWDFVRLTRCVTGPSPRPQRLRSSLGAFASMRPEGLAELRRRDVDLDSRK
ncbi:hypothetical protein [Streptomyces sp. NBC_00893]|uniref:hypothetical protein n=1 Tax=Streptomyces sp. NBC_00893 TaxID=2975862 RepID=UPI002250F8D4|nr:hypothetical protein [Streptomyces sp. NBC_00893]